MSDERTLPASPRRRTEAIEQFGQPRSAGLTGAIVLVCVVGYGVIAGTALLERTSRWMEGRLRGTIMVADARGELIPELQTALWAAVGLSGELLLVGWCAAMAAELSQTGGRFSAVRLGPHRMLPSPLAALRSPGGLLLETLRWLLPLAAVGMILNERWPEIARLITQSPGQWPEQLGQLISSMGARCACIMLAVGGVQYVRARWNWEQSLLMTADEQRDEQRLDGGQRCRWSGSRRTPTAPHGDVMRSE
jgi:flagellar biosynthesis protein FlhB